MQLSKEQIDAVAEWMNEKVFSKKNIDKFIQDFSPKEKPYNEKPKAYILQKDLPGVKAGAKVIPIRLNCEAPDELSTYKIVIENSALYKDYKFEKDFVHNTPGWFLPEEESKGKFYVRTNGENEIEIGKIPEESWENILPLVANALKSNT